MNGDLNAPAWLVARPIAHRGLHAAVRGVIENSLSAMQRAIEKTYAIECDVQASLDGEAMVFHDETFDRLIGIAGEIGARAAPEIARLAYQGSADRIASLSDVFTTVAGRVPLIVELKSRFDGDFRLAGRVAQLAETYAGPLAFKSFDPQILGAFRTFAVTNPLGLVAQANYGPAEWPRLTELARNNLEALTDFPRAKPDFLSWRVGDLPHAVPLLCRAGLGMKVMAWTVRNEAERAVARKWADQIVFEGFEA